MSSAIFTLCGVNYMKKRTVVNVLLVVTPLLIGIASSILTRDMMLEYGNLNKPFLAPPTILFPIAWTILYLLMGIGAALIYSKEEYKGNRSTGITLHIAQLILNFFWSIIFFNYKNYELALIWLVMLWLTVLAMLVYYSKVNKLAFVFNVPYILWLTFAGYLNYFILLNN